jgi:hypothetical protein
MMRSAPAEPVLVLAMRPSSQSPGSARLWPPPCCPHGRGPRQRAAAGSHRQTVPSIADRQGIPSSLGRGRSESESNDGSSDKIVSRRRGPPRARSRRNRGRDRTAIYANLEQGSAQLLSIDLITSGNCVAGYSNSSSGGAPVRSFRH